MPAFYLLLLRISYPNHSVVVSVIPVFVLLSPRIGYTNRYVVVGTRPLIGAWAVMKYLLPRTLYIIRCVAVWKEMVFVGRTSNTQTYKLTTHITPLSPWRGAGGEAFFSFTLASSPLQPYSLATLIGVQRTVVDAGE